MEKAVKHLSVKWVPDTLAAISLTAAVGVERGTSSSEKMIAALNSDAPVRRIVIFQGADLRTDVLMTR